MKQLRKYRMTRILHQQNVVSSNHQIAVSAPPPALRDGKGELTQEYLNYLFEYRDGNIYRRHSKYPRRIGGKVGSLSNRYYKTVIDGTNMLVHRIIFKMFHGHLPEFLDHKDGNPLNNRIENLRPATREQNAQNIGVKSSNSSGVKGVQFCKRTQKWHALIFYGGGPHSLGRFATLELATDAYRVAALKFHDPEFVRFP